MFRRRDFNHLVLYKVDYFPHMWRALKFCFKCYLWTGEVLIHAFIPDLCTQTAEKMKEEIRRLEES